MVALFSPAAMPVSITSCTAAAGTITKACAGGSGSDARSGWHLPPQISELGGLTGQTFPGKPRLRRLSESCLGQRARSEAPTMAIEAGLNRGTGDLNDTEPADCSDNVLPRTPSISIIAATRPELGKDSNAAACRKAI